MVLLAMRKHRPGTALKRLLTMRNEGGRAIPRAMNIIPARGSRIFLAMLPFILIAIVYVIGSAERRAANPDDKLLPPVSEMVETSKRLAAEPDRRSGDYVLWADTAASLQRMALGLGIAALTG